MAKITIETGIKTYDIENEKGEYLGQISFNPKDANLLRKLLKIEDTIGAIIEDAQAYKIQNENAPEMEIAEKMGEYDKIIKEYVDDVFGEGTSDTIFASQNVFNEFKGKPFIIRFIDAILPAMKADIDAEAKKSRKKVKKYTDEVVD